MSFVRKSWVKLIGTRRGVMSIMSGTAVGQALAFLAAPLLSRVYSPEDFGLFATCTAITLILGTVCTLRFELAVPLPVDDSDAMSLVWLAIFSAILFGLTFTGVVALLGPWAAALLAQPELSTWLWLVPFTATLMGLYLTLNQLAIRHHRFATIGRRNVLQQATIVIAQLVSGLAGLRPGGLVLGYNVGQLASVISLVPGSRLFSREFRDARRPAALSGTARRYRRFPLFMGPAGLLNVLGLQLPILLLATWYGPSVAGWLGLTQRVLALPVALIGTAVGQVYLAHLTKMIRDGADGALSMFKRTSLKLAAVSVPVVTVLVIGGPWLFESVFGPAWRTSGDYSRGLAIALAAQMIAAPISQTLIALERQRAQLCWDAARVAVIIAVVGAAKMTGLPAMSAIWTVAVTLAVMYAVSWLMSFTAVKSLDRSQRDAVAP